MNWQRLESEAMRDPILALSGRLERTEGGPGAGGCGRGFRGLQVVSIGEKDERRRTIYTFSVPKRGDAHDGGIRRSESERILRAGAV